MIFIVTLFIFNLASLLAINNRPIIGIFTQPTTSTQGNCGGNCLYIAASYVKYIESSGGRVVPINYYASQDELDILFDSLNGFLFPGGGSSYPESAQYIYDKIKLANDKGDFMPLWGTCMGFQWLLIAQSKDTSILDPPSGQMDAYNYSIPLMFTSLYKTSKLFSHAPQQITDILQNQNVTMNNHHYGIFPSHFEKTESLVTFFNVLSTNYDRKGVEFVSTIESKAYPIFGSQWHPEKNNFEFGETDGIPNEAIDHSKDAIVVSQYTANFFVEQTRHSTHSFTSPDAESAALIYNYSPSYTTGSFVQEYFFKNNFSPLSEKK